MTSIQQPSSLSNVLIYSQSFRSLGPPEIKPKDPASSGDSMVSRRKILSRSRDDLNLDAVVQEEEDVWYQKDKLFRVSFSLIKN